MEKREERGKGKEKGSVEEEREKGGWEGKERGER